MFKPMVAALALGTAVLALPAMAQQGPAAAPAAPAAPTAASGVPVRDNGLVGTWYPPASGQPGPVILVLGGSEGGEAGARLTASRLAEQGYGVLALAYFRAPGLPEQLIEIPLEYFAKAIDWIEAQPLADPRRIGLYGVSKGGEAALAIAAHQPEIRAVVAAVPSSVVWQGINYADYSDNRSTFSLNGRPVPYLAYDMSAPFTSIHDLYQRSLAKGGQQEAVQIPVERIAGAVLLLSGEADALWPSSAMSEQVVARLKAKGFRHAYRHIAYRDAGHAVAVPAGVKSDYSPGANMGGTEAGNRAARADAWSQTLAFFARHLGGPAR